MNRRDCLTAAQVGTCLLACMAMAHTLLASNSTQTQDIDAILTAAGVRSGNVPGAAILVLRDGHVLFECGYGVTDLRSLHRIDEHTNFRLASVTKQFTAMAIMLLVHDGKLHYDDRLTDIFPEFPEYGKTITIRNLLNHTSGLQDYEDLMPQLDPHVAIEQSQIQDAGVLDLLEQQKSMKFKPGSKWAYSNSGYVVLGLIVQRVSGQSFPDFLHNRIFAPLGMTSTVAYVHGKNDVSARAFGHTLDNGTWKETDQSLTSATLGDGGVYSSLQDLAKWDQALQMNTLLSEREMQAALTPARVVDDGVTEPDGAHAEYGFGWFLNSYKSHRRMWHYGETMGFRTAIQRFIDDDLTIIVLSNRADLNPSGLALQIADLYLKPVRKQ